MSLCYSKAPQGWLPTSNRVGHLHAKSTNVIFTFVHIAVCEHTSFITDNFKTTVLLLWKYDTGLKACRNLFTLLSKSHKRNQNDKLILKWWWSDLSPEEKQLQYNVTAEKWQKNKQYQRMEVYQAKISLTAHHLWMCVSGTDRKKTNTHTHTHTHNLSRWKRKKESGRKMWTDALLLWVSVVISK